MSHKTIKKKNHLPSKKQSTIALPIPIPWPNLPKHLIALISRQSKLMQNITSFGCVTKSWKSASRQCRLDKPRCPQLVEINTQDDHHSERPRYHTLDIEFQEEYPYCCYVKRYSYVFNLQQSRGYFKGHSHGNVVVMGPGSMDSYLLEPDIMSTSRNYLPPWDHNFPFKCSTLSSFPDDSINGCSVLVLTGISTPAFAFYNLGQNKLEWTYENCTINEPYVPDQYMQFTNAIGFRGKFYMLSLQGSLVVIEAIGSCLRITGFGSAPAVPSKVPRQFREYLLECNGKILLVFLVSRKSINHVDDVEVFRLDIHKLVWVKVDNLGDWSLFIEDECCMAVDSRKVKCGRNCVFFSHYRVDHWCVFEMENGKISQIFDTDNQKRGSIMWEVPKDEE